MADARDDAPALHVPHVLLAGGGTGGHVFPALAVAQELLARGWRVSFTGMAEGLEARLVGERGLPFFPLPARPLLGKGVRAKVAALGTTARGAVAAARLVRRLGADAVLGTGGYVSAPAVLGARLARRPVLLLEPNARAGVANRWLSRVATAAAVAFAETRRDLECPSVVTGIPVRAAFFSVPPPPALGQGDRKGGPRLLVLGGSQGARQVNAVLPEAVARVRRSLPGLTVLHQAGAKNVEETRAAYQAAGLGAPLAPDVDVVPFLDDVAGAMAASHLVVSRSGAITVAEICAAGRAAVLLPLAIAQAHQVENARLLAEAGAAEMLVGAEATSEALAARLIALLADGARLARMGKAARTLARPDAVAAIADRLAEMIETFGARRARR